MTELKIIIDGMFCASCSSASERSIKKLNGVKDCTVNLSTGTAIVNYDNSICTENDIIKAVEKAGFSARLLTAETKILHDENEKTEALKTKRNFIISLVFSLPLSVIAMGSMWGLKLPSVISMGENPFNFAILQLLLLLPILFVGRNFYTVGYKAIFNLTPNMDSLVALGTTASFLFSLYSLFKIITDPTAIHRLYFESSGMIITFVLMGRFLESKSKNKTNDSIYKLMSLTPKTTTLLRGEEEITVASANLVPGDIILIKPGESVSCDGEIIHGKSKINESMLTGESDLKEKNIGDTVFSGTINTNGALKVKVTKDSKNTYLSSIIQFVENAKQTKAPIAKLADKISGIFVPTVFLIALISSAIWLVIGKEFYFALTVFVSVLVVACPCALGLATPTAIITSTGACARRGILIKNGEALELSGKIDTVIFDKTGTLTQGKPTVNNFECFIDKEEFFALALSCEKNTDHPYGIAIAEYCKNATPFNVTDFINIEGKGIECIVNSKKVLIGNKKLLEDNNISVNDGSFIYMAVDGKYAGNFTVSDSIKPETKETVKELNKMGITCVMLTGDNEVQAKNVSEQLGINEYYSQMLPTQKAEIINKYKQNGKCVAFVGDGINDAPALTVSDIGISLNTGTDVAMESSQIVLTSNTLKSIPQALNIGKRAMRIIKQNLFWAFAYNSICIPIAAGLLYSFGTALINPMFAALAMSLSSVTVVSNSLRLRK